MSDASEWDQPATTTPLAEILEIKAVSAVFNVPFAPQRFARDLRRWQAVTPKRRPRLKKLRKGMPKQ